MKTLLIIATGAAFSLTGAALAEGDAAQGEKIFKKCRSCHTISNGDEVIFKGGKTGPNLYAVIGRVAGSADFKFSKSMIAAGEGGLIWTEDLIAEFVANPSAFLKTTMDDSKAKSKMPLKLKKGGADVAAYLASVSPDAASAQSAAEEIAAAKAAAEKYQDVNVALADGFIRDPANACVSAAEEGLPSEWGAMGIHYLNMARLQITGDDPRVDGIGTNTDFTTPAVLMYEPQADGTLVLLGIENLVFQKAWHDAGNSEPPSFGGSVWDAMADDPATAGDEAHGFEPHYDRHVWVFRDNPAGILVPFNPAVTCEHHGEG